MAHNKNENDSEVLTRSKVKINNDVQPPNLYSIVYFNDEVTPADFVVETLIDIFKLSIETAISLTEIIHTKGSEVIVQGLTKELASHLRDLVLVNANMYSYPLKVEIKEE